MRAHAWEGALPPIYALGEGGRQRPLPIPSEMSSYFECWGFLCLGHLTMSNCMGYCCEGDLIIL